MSGGVTADSASSGSQSSVKKESVVQRHPALIYFGFTFAISWTGALMVAARHLLRHEAVPKFSGLMMFPVMLLGPSVAGVVLTWIADGKQGLRALFARVLRVRFPVRWFATLLIAPCLVLGVLECLKTFVSPAFGSNRFWIGLAFGIPAGFFEEIGWMGFAYPKLAERRNAFAAAIVLGLMWSAWHLPVIDFLGVATPHAAYWLPFALAFGLTMTAMRVVIAWAYCNTGSVLLAQLLHVVSTGSLVVFGPARVGAREETLWYGVYGVGLWVVVGVVLGRFGVGLGGRQ